MSKLPLFEDFIPLGFASSRSSKYSMGSIPDIKTGYNMNAIVGPIMELSQCIAKEAELYDSDEDPSHTFKDYIKEAKSYVMNSIDEVCENVDMSIDEANDNEYDPGAHAERLKRREEQNIQRYRAAQDRGDNYAIALYELRIKLDKIDFEKLKVLKAIEDLKEKFNKKDN